MERSFKGRTFLKTVQSAVMLAISGLIVISGCAQHAVAGDITVSESLLSPATINSIDEPMDNSTSASLSFVELAKKQNRDLSHLERMDFYRRNSFWVGAVGGIFSFVADKRGNVIGRTVGNGLWGIGWTCWLGFGAVVRADVRQIMEVDHVGSNEKPGRAAGTGSDSWAVVWRFAAF